jgi:ribosomal protein S18 acetylase RimI-like enzyme
VHVGDTVYSVITVRSLAADEGLLLKRLRLAALQESPDAFSPTFEAANLHDDNYWKQSAVKTVASAQFDIFIAEITGQPVGLVSGSVSALVSGKAHETQTGHIGMMWADPNVRGRGVGRALLSHVMDYLGKLNCLTIELTVTETNQGAISLYESTGFVFTGNDEPLREGSILQNREMRLVAN